MLNAQELDGLGQVAPFRSQRLFCEFLPMGYTLTTLDTVECKNAVVELKIILGTLITLYDDYADRPDKLNPRLLQLLYRVPFERVTYDESLLSRDEIIAIELAKSLFNKLLRGMEQFRNYHLLFEIFCFDLKQFFLANHYSELLSQHMHLSNERENRLYLHHNMGIVMAGMIDLMNVPKFCMTDLGHARSLFLMGQRAGRISNVLTTFERELAEDDRTNELLVSGNPSDLEAELASLIQAMSKVKNIKSFSASEYSKGIKSLHDLHLRLKGVI
jgi:hypothetical protein